jgi:hypothetical protein
LDRAQKEFPVCIKGRDLLRTSYFDNFNNAILKKMKKKINFENRKEFIDIFFNL